MTWLRRLDRLGGGLPVDVLLYVVSAAFAATTAATSTLAPHRAWGAVAAIGYGAAALLAVAQWTVPTLPRGPLARGVLAVAAFGATTVVPLVQQAAQRAGGRTDRAQEEVVVIEDAARRLVETGTPYLDRAAIAALPEPLLGYLPYQPGMAVFGLPRAVGGVHPLTDARVWFAVATVAALAAALILLARRGVPAAALVRALQAATVLPICALTLATGGDDLPVLALCLLALACAATGRPGGAGVAVGAAAALKLFAWPVAVVLAFTVRGPRYLVPAVAIPTLTLVPAAVIDPGALVENVIAFPFGRGLVTSPAASPLPGHLLAAAFPAGRYLVYALLVALGLGIAVRLLRRPPRDAAEAALLCGLGLLAAMLLLPATRFGYLLYPAALLLWIPALRPVAASTPAGVARAD